jgi:DNA helicase-2/ATP-dependent DNA helicase PcrA
MVSLHDVNPQQREAIKTVEGPLMVIAGPGSGKTRVLVYRIAHLVNIGVPPYNIIALTFTNKAAKEMKERIRELVGERSSSLWMGTFHHLCARLLRYECHKLGFEKNFSIYDTQDSLNLIKSVMNQLGISTQQFNPYAIQNRISRAKNQLMTQEVFAVRAADLFEEKVGVIYKKYQDRLKENNAMDFDDLLMHPINLFTSHKKVLSDYQDRFRFILIDEYQDTNHAQYVFIKLLAEKFRNICAVGDDAQSIYAFRGADIRNILDFERDYKEGKVIRLEQNYRSTKTILAAADQLIKRNGGQISKNLWTKNKQGDAIALLECEDDKDEGEMICRRIYATIQSKKYDFKHIAIMYRTNAQSRSLEDALRRSSIPYTIVGGVEFYQRKEVKDVLAYLRCLVNPKDNESVLRIINYPNRGVGSVSIKKIQHHADENHLSVLLVLDRIKDIAGISDKTKNACIALNSLIKKYNKLREQISLGEMARAFVDELGILRMFKEEGTPESMSRWENVQELLSGISEFEASREKASLEDFLQEVSLVAEVDRWDTSFNAVTLMTLHSAKGLEFPTVFIAGLEEGLLPLYSPQFENNDIEEERRLFYVGITRAMETLCLSRARLRFRYGELSYQTPSRFLDEINSSLIETEISALTHSERISASRIIPLKRNRARRSERKYSEESHFADIDPRVDYSSDEEKMLVAGTLVEHESFGKGKVVHVNGKGDTMKAVVDFESVGRKNLMVKYARLKLL